MPCPVCNRTIASGDFCDDLQCPNPTRDGTEGAGDGYCHNEGATFCSICGLAKPGRVIPDKVAPPKPAPDAMREALSALEPFTKLGGGQNPRDAAAGLHYATYYDLPGDTVVYENSGACITADDVRTARRVYKTHSIPMSANWTVANDLVKSIVRQAAPALVPPADGAGVNKDVLGEIDAAWAFAHTCERGPDDTTLGKFDAAVRKHWPSIRNALSSSDTGAAEPAEPVAWIVLSEHLDDLGYEKSRIWWREAIARALYDLNPSMSSTQFSGPEPTHWCYDSRQKQLAFKQADAILSLRVQPGAGERWPKSFESAPRDGSWIIARCNDHSEMYKLRFNGEHWDCPEASTSFGDGLFLPNGDWIPDLFSRRAPPSSSEGGR